MAEIDWKEARRYLGLHRPGGVVDERLEEALRACGTELEAAARPRAVWRRFPLTVEEGRTVCAGMDIPSAHLARHLKDGDPGRSPTTKPREPGQGPQGRAHRRPGKHSAGEGGHH